MMTLSPPQELVSIPVVSPNCDNEFSGLCLQNGRNLAENRSDLGYIGLPTWGE